MRWRASGRDLDGPGEERQHMQYKQLGRTGLYVSELCLGTMTFGGVDERWGRYGRLVQEEADTLLRLAVDAGVNFIDTADMYSDGRSEEIVGQAIRNLGLRRDEVVVATKAFGAMGQGPNTQGNSRYHLLNACKASLRRMQLDHIDLYLLHGFDAATPMEETMLALDALIEQGHVRYIGVSNWAAWQFASANGAAGRLGLNSRFNVYQGYYTIATRDLEREVLPMARSEQVGVMVWSPLAGGLLSGKYPREQEAGAEGRRANVDFPPIDRARAWKVIDTIRPMADQRGASVAQVALAWLLHQRGVSSVIVGANKPAQLADNLGAVQVKLTEQELQAIDEVSRLAPEFPGWMVERQGGGRRALAAGR